MDISIYHTVKRGYLGQRGKLEQNNALTLSYLYYFPNKFFLVILLVLNRDNNTEFIKIYFNIVIIIRLLLRNLIKNIQKHEKMYLHKTTLDLSEVVMGFAQKIIE